MENNARSQIRDQKSKPKLKIRNDLVLNFGLIFALWSLISALIIQLL